MKPGMGKKDVTNNEGPVRRPSSPSFWRPSLDQEEEREKNSPIRRAYIQDTSISVEKRKTKIGNKPPSVRTLAEAAPHCCTMSSDIQITVATGK